MSKSEDRSITTFSILAVVSEPNPAVKVWSRTWKRPVRRGKQRQISCLPLGHDRDFARGQWSWDCLSFFVATSHWTRQMVFLEPFLEFKILRVRRYIGLLPHSMRLNSANSHSTVGWDLAMDSLYCPSFERHRCVGILFRFGVIWSAFSSAPLFSYAVINYGPTWKPSVITPYTAESWWKRSNFQVNRALTRMPSTLEYTANVLKPVSVLFRLSNYSRWSPFVWLLRTECLVKMFTWGNW